MQFDQKISALQKQIQGYSREELLWFNGYLSGLLANNQIATSTQVESKSSTVQLNPVVLYGSETGNSKKLAFELLKLFKQNNIQAKCFDLATYKVKQLVKEEFVLFICSTQGEGEAPVSAQRFFDELANEALDLSTLSYSVLGLGDSSYPLFCKAAEDLQILLNKHGGVLSIPSQNLGVDYKTAAHQWFKEVINNVLNRSVTPIHNAVENRQELNTQPKEISTRTKRSYKGIIGHSIILNDRESNKKTYHIELESDEELDYSPGDAVGIYPKNKHEVCAEIATLFKATDRAFELEKLTITGLSGNTLKKLEDILTIEVTDKRIDLIDLLNLYPANKQVTFDQLLTVLVPMSPRLYSISSSALTNSHQVTITVALAEFESNGVNKSGVCSSFLSSLSVGQDIEFYIHPNSEFYLPNADTDIVMVGPGTGIAPFRSFLQHRDLRGDSGRNWLFFGEQHFVCDFYYQTEIQQWLESGVLTKLDTAFSRDQKYKIYVQDRLRQQSKQLWQWIESGAILYVCGQKSPMSQDVENALVEIIRENTQSSEEQAVAYLDTMFLNGQYKKDVY